MSFFEVRGSGSGGRSSATKSETGSGSFTVLRRTGFMLSAALLPASIDSSSSFSHSCSRFLILSSAGSTSCWAGAGSDELPTRAALPGVVVSGFGARFAVG